MIRAFESQCKTRCFWVVFAWQQCAAGFNPSPAILALCPRTPSSFPNHLWVPAGLIASVPGWMPQMLPFASILLVLLGGCMGTNCSPGMLTCCMCHSMHISGICQRVPLMLATTEETPWFATYCDTIGVFGGLGGFLLHSLMFLFWVQLGP